MPDILDELNEKIAELKQLKAEVLDPAIKKQSYDPAADLGKAMAHTQQGGIAAAISAGLLGLGSAGQHHLQESVVRAADRVKSGDMSDIEQVLAEQFLLFNALTLRYADIASTSHAESQVRGPQALDMALKCSRATRQIGAAIAGIKKPKKTTFVKNQVQNILVAKLDALEEKLNRLEVATNAKMDVGSAGSTAPADLEAAAVEVFDRAKD
ncbi:MAG: hypothetical protein ACTS2F_27650 [Thainema sp.]